MDTFRYLIDFDTEKMPKEYFDILIIGSGIAGVYTALELDEKYNIAVVTKEEVEISNSVLAQGGIAVSLDKNDSPDMHLKDTLYAGAGLCNEKSVRVLVDEAAKNISRVCNYGVKFDKSENKDTLALSREAAHSTNRIIHAGDSTGKAVCDTLIHRASQRKNISILERIWVLDLLVKDQRCYGVIALDEKSNTYRCFYAGMVICASGGYGQLYTYTTNPEVSTGDGAAFAYRAGTPLMDMEFVQFHPTVLYHKENRSFLISEAVRGDGAVLRNGAGERFMPNYHELAELAPRDVVSRSIFKEMKRTGESHMWLDITHKDRAYLENRFPMIFATCLSYGIDMSKDYIPIAPAEHYCMGGIKTGIYGETEIRNFFACGEAACNGIHGANRLASNSLLEGLVFGHRIGAQAEALLAGSAREMPRFQYTADRKPQPDTYQAEVLLQQLKETMTHLVGIERNKEGLTEALETVKAMRASVWDMENKTPDDFIVQNDTMLAQLIIESAIQREESRGAHYRSDFPERDDLHWQHNIEKRVDNDVEF